MKYYLAIDFGGTRLRAALFDDSFQIVKRTETLSMVSEGQEAVLERIITTGKSVLPDDVEPLAIGIAAPGPLDAEQGIIIKAETLPNWHYVPIRQIVSDAFGGVPTYVQNDGNLGALAEYHQGAGKATNPMIYMTISTGIGGGIIINGNLFTGVMSLAAEPGHMRLTLPDGSHRRLEELASGTALATWANHYLNTTDSPSSLRILSNVDGKAVGEAATSGDLFALQIVQQAGIWLGLGLVNIVHLFNPEAIVLGGSVTKLGDLILAPAVQTLRENILFDGFIPENLIRYAQNDEDMCLLGAVHHCKYQLMLQSH
ncbi:MAG: ROK family protein [Chloroflexota bacterium]